MKNILKMPSVLSGIGGFVLTAVILLGAYLAGGMFPFSEGTVAWCDMNQQLIPLFCDFKDILQGKASLFLNLQNAGGMNFYGVYFFFLSSPFSFLVALVDKADIPFLMNIMVLLKLSLCGLTAGVVLNRIFPKNGIFIASFLGASYALCGYGMLFYQNIMWLDMMYLFPIVVLGIYKLIKDNRPWLLALALTLCVIFNFYISFMVYIFVILFFGIYALFFKETDRRLFVNLAFSGIISLLASAFVWVPCLLQYFSSARSGSIIAGLKSAPLFATTNTTLPILLCSGIIFAVIFMIIPKLSARSKASKFLLCILTVMTIPLILEPVNLMWHTGSYMAFPARYGFITVFIGLLTVAKYLTSLSPAEKSKPRALWVYLSTGLLCIFALIFTLSDQKNLSVYTRTLWGNDTSLRGQIFICFLFALAYFLILFSLKRKNLCKNTAIIFLCLTLAFEGFCWSDVFMLTAKDKLNLKTYNNMLSLREEPLQDSFFRVNTSQKLTDANMTGAAGFNSLAHYTSLNGESYMKAVKQMGYSGYWMETGNWGGSIISDALLSVGYTIYNQNGELIMRKNPYYLGLGIKASGNIPRGLSDKDRLCSIGEAFSELTATENPVITYPAYITEGCALREDESGYVIDSVLEEAYISYSVGVIGKQALYFDCYDGFSNNLTEPINQSFEIYVNSKIKTCSYPTSRENGLLKLGNFENETVNIIIKVLKPVSCSSLGVFGVDEDLVKGAIEKTETLNLTQNGGKITGAALKGSYFLSIPYSKDLHITLDGKELGFSKALGGFISLDIPSNGQLEIHLLPRGLSLGIGLSIMGIFLFILWLVFGKRNFRLSEGLKNSVYGIFLGGFALVVMLVYIIPIIVSLSDFKV